MPKLKAQLHIHTKQDAIENIKHTEKEMITRAAELGYDILAITCHNVFIFNEDLQKFAEEKRILLIPGIEKSVENKHVLILNADVEAQKIHTFNDLRLYKKKKTDCFLIAAHPYYPGSICLKEKLEENIDIFDGIEYSWYHSKRINRFNKKAIKTAEKHGLPMIGTSDNHILRYFDATYSIIDTGKKDIPSVFNALRDKKVTFVSHNLTPWKMLCIVTEMWVRQFIKKITLR